MGNTLSIDLKPFMAISLATNPSTIKGVDALYEKYKFKAYELAKNSKFYSHPLICDGSIKREVSAKRALGLLCLNELRTYEELDKEIVNLFIKGWSTLHKYVSKIDLIDIEFVINNIVLKKDDDDYYVGFNTALLLFSKIHGKEIIQNDFMNDILNFLNDYLTHIEKGKKRFSYNFVKERKEVFDRAKKITNRFYDNFISLNNTCDLVELAITNEELADYCKSINAIFDSEDMSLASMTDNLVINEKDIIELAGLYYIDNNNQNRLESAKFMLFGLFLKYSIKAYKDLKKYYFKNNKETLFIELECCEEKAKSLEDENNALRRSNDILVSENSKLKKDYKESIEKENILLKREVQKLKNVIANLEREKDELKTLTDSFFEIDYVSLSSDININIPNVKGVIAGGHQIWHSKLKEVLPDSFVFIEGDYEQFDERILANKDFVFIYTKYMSHGFYYKLIDKCKRSNIRFYYISYTSPDYVKSEISNILSKT